MPFTQTRYTGYSKTYPLNKVEVDTVLGQRRAAKKAHKVLLNLNLIPLRVDRKDIKVEVSMVNKREEEATKRLERIYKKLREEK